MVKKYRIFEVLAVRHNRYYYELVEDDDHFFPLIGKYRTMEDAESAMTSLEVENQNKHIG